MIPWQKYDPENPPEIGKRCIVINNNTHSKIPRIAVYRLWFGNCVWLTFEGNQHVENITHYAPINLPGEETTT